MLEEYEDEPNLREAVPDACDYVNQKYDFSSADPRADASDLIEQKAARLGLALTPVVDQS